MRGKTAVALVLSALMAASPAFAAEDLFDTKAAAAHIEKGIAHLKAKKYDAAIAEFDEAASIHPDAEPFYYLGYAYYMKGKAGDEASRKKAMENFEKAYELNPNFTPSRFAPAEEGMARPQKPQEPPAAPAPEKMTEEPLPQPEQPAQPQQ